MQTLNFDTGSMIGLDDVRKKLADKWGGILALGLAMAVLGATAIANAFTTTYGSMVGIGALMILGGLLHLFYSFRLKAWNFGLPYFLLATFYMISGLLAIAQPIAAAAGLTLMIAIFLMFGGAARLFSSLMMRTPANGWSFANGVLSFILGLLILIQWPLSGLWVIGFYVGLSLFFDGIALSALAIIVKPKRIPIKTRTV